MYWSEPHIETIHMTNITSNVSADRENAMYRTLYKYFLLLASNNKFERFIIGNMHYIVAIYHHRRLENYQICADLSTEATTKSNYSGNARKPIRILFVAVHNINRQVSRKICI